MIELKTELANGNTEVRTELDSGYWEVAEYDQDGNKVYELDSNGLEVHIKYLTNGNTIKTSRFGADFGMVGEYDSNGKCIFSRILDGQFNE